jgi:hypothetical protein
VDVHLGPRPVNAVGFRLRSMRSMRSPTRYSNFWPPRPFSRNLAFFANDASFEQGLS